MRKTLLLNDSSVSAVRPLCFDGVDVGSCALTAAGLPHEAFHVVRHVQVVRDRLAADIGLRECVKSRSMTEPSPEMRMHLLAVPALVVDGEYEDCHQKT